MHAHICTLFRHMHTPSQCTLTHMHSHTTHVCMCTHTPPITVLVGFWPRASLEPLLGEVGIRAGDQNPEPGGREERREGGEPQSHICQVPNAPLTDPQTLSLPTSSSRGSQEGPQIPPGATSSGSLAPSHLYLYFTSGKCNSPSLHLDAFGLEVTSNPQ